MILERYLGAHLVKGWLLVTLVLAAVFGLIGFIQELDHTNKGYGTLAAAQYTLLVLPGQLVGLAPVIALLGSIQALANLDRNNELTIVSCTGYPPSRLLLALSLPTLALMVLLWTCLEYVTPQLQQTAERERLLIREGGSGWIPRGGAWSTDGRRYIHLKKISENSEPGLISLFEFSEKGELIRALSAHSATVSDDRRWVFRNVREKVMSEGQIDTRSHDKLEIANLWSKDELPSLTAHYRTMNLSVLHEYYQYLALNGQQVDKYRSTFWQNLLMPLTVWAMVMLATPISASVTAGRDRSYGLNIGIGAIIGIVFYLGAQTLFSLGQLLQWNVPFVALLPTLLILLCAGMMLRRMRW